MDTFSVKISAENFTVDYQVYSKHEVVAKRKALQMFEDDYPHIVDAEVVSCVRL